MSGDPGLVPTAPTRRSFIRQNLFWAFVAMLLAALGLLDAMVAAAAMAVGLYRQLASRKAATA